ncbi:hypothetical protein FRC06_003768, partial [Ceratobasidium sp. 370]
MSPLTKTGNTPAASKRAVDPLSYLAAHPLPNNLNDIDGLAIWALRFAEERAQALNEGQSIPGPSKAQQPPYPSSTADHVAQSIANHRSQLDGNDQPGQSTHTSNMPPCAPMPNDGDAQMPDTDTTSGPRKPRHSKKSKLRDFPGLM